jgi:3-methyladenine DNA glycosylase/8-oxoguanine DNA glycosylase
MKTSRHSISTPRSFNFTRTALSHGWYGLVPFSYDKATRRLHRTIQIDDGVIVHCIMTGKDHSIDVEIAGSSSLNKRQYDEVKTALRTCLRLDEDFDEFHAEAKRHSTFRWIARAGAGRMLRSPSVFEDVVKMICTTNCTWALTTIMVTNLVQKFGNRFDGNTWAFPSPGVIAGSSERVLRKEIKAGYRSPYLLELAERVASGKLNLEAWKESSLSTDELFKEMRSVKGIGPYAAGNVMKLIGRYDYLGLDSWVRAKYYELHHNNRKVKDSTIERHYRPYGKWRGLFFWLEMTRSWHNDKFSA